MGEENLIVTPIFSLVLTFSFHIYLPLSFILIYFLFFFLYFWLKFLLNFYFAISLFFFTLIYLSHFYLFFFVYISFYLPCNHSQFHFFDLLVIPVFIHLELLSFIYFIFLDNFPTYTSFPHLCLTPVFLSHFLYSHILTPTLYHRQFSFFLHMSSACISYFQLFSLITLFRFIPIFLHLSFPLFFLFPFFPYSRNMYAHDRTRKGSKRCFSIGVGGRKSCLDTGKHTLGQMRKRSVTFLVPVVAIFMAQLQMWVGSWFQFQLIGAKKELIK